MTDAFIPLPPGIVPRLDVDTRPGTARPFCILWTGPDHGHLTVVEVRNGAVPLMMDVAPLDLTPGPATARIVPFVLGAGGVVVESFTSLDPALRTMRLFEDAP